MTRSVAPDALLISTDRQGTVLVLALAGELDLINVDYLNRALHEAEAAGEESLAIDLRAVEFIDSAGLHALIQLHDRCSNNGCRLTLRRPSRQVRRLLQITGTLDMFSFD